MLRYCLGFLPLPINWTFDSHWLFFQIWFICLFWLSLLFWGWHSSPSPSCKPLYLCFTPKIIVLHRHRLSHQHLCPSPCVPVTLHAAALTLGHEWQKITLVDSFNPFFNSPEQQVWDWVYSATAGGSLFFSWTTFLNYVLLPGLFLSVIAASVWATSL